MSEGKKADPGTPQSDPAASPAPSAAKAASPDAAPSHAAPRTPRARPARPAGPSAPQAGPAAVPPAPAGGTAPRPAPGAAARAAAAAGAGAGVKPGVQGSGAAHGHGHSHPQPQPRPQAHPPVEEVKAEIVQARSATGLVGNAGQGEPADRNRRLLQRYYNRPLRKIHWRDYFTWRFQRSLLKFLRLKWRTQPLRVRLPTIIILLPTFVSFLYFLICASPMYISQTSFAIKSTSQASGSESPGLGSMGAMLGMGGAASQDALLVEEYLRSIDAYHDIDAELHITEHYSSRDHDMISRLWSNPTLHDRLIFWQNVSTVSVNTDSGVITYEVRAYDPQTAYDIAQQALVQSERIVNEMNERMHADSISRAASEVHAAELRLKNSQLALETFRTEHRDLDLKTTASGMQSLILELEAQATQIRAQIAESSQYMHADSPAMRALQARLEGIQRQIIAERERLTATSSDGMSLNTLASTYENLMIETEFANQQLVYAMSTLERAKTESLTKNLYMVTVAKPTLPDESLYPETFMFTLYILFALGFAYLVGSVVVSAIREHVGY